jgi:hypothetical protein
MYVKITKFITFRFRGKWKNSFVSNTVIYKQLILILKPEIQILKPEIQ